MQDDVELAKAKVTSQLTKNSHAFELTFSPVIQEMLKHEQEANEKEQELKKNQDVAYGDLIQVTMIILMECTGKTG